MNKQAYRVIFSQVVGTFIAVAENVSGQGKAKSKSINTTSAPTSKNLSLRFSTLSVMVAAMFGSVTVAHAQMVAYKNGAGPRPTIDRSANGRPVVQIVTPNATGLSHNRYDQFNVDKNGVILNNSPTITQTQLGGLIQGNPNIAPGATAKVILNEVMSTNRSLLNGFIEVAGERANVIVANPNGISIGGLGFINTSRGVLTTGTPVFGGDGSLAAFRVSKGDISVGAGGINATGTDQLDLIARSVQVNDALWANQINVVAGSNQVNYANLGVQVIAGEGDRPTVGIDSAALGGMYAQKIMLIGTEAGVGVRTLGTISASAGDILIDSYGKISLHGQTNAKGQLQLRSDDDINNTGTLYGQQAVAIASRGQVTNSGTLAAFNNLTINADSINSSGVLGAGINSAGQATEAGNLILNSSGLITATGQNIAGSNIAFTGSGITFTDGTTSANTSANGAITLTATGGDINHAGATLVSTGGTTLTATGNIINDAGMINAGQLALRSAALSNVGGTLMQSGTGNTQINTTGKWNNNGGKLVSNGQYLQVQTGSLSNAGGNISHAGNGALTITTGELDNTDGNIEALAGLNITADDLINTAGTIQNLGAYALNLQVNQRLSNTKKNNVSGLIGSASDIIINAGEIDNTEGTIYSKKNLLLQSDGALINQGGVIQSNGIVNAVAGGVINNQYGRIEANGNGVNPASETLRISGSSINNTAGRIANSSTGSTTLSSASSITNDTGVIGGNGDVTLKANTLNNTQQGQVIAAGNLNLQLAINLNNNQGSLYAAKNLFLQQRNATVSNQQGKISAAGKITLDVASLDNTLGQIISSTASEATKADNSEAGDIALTVANQLNNTGGTIGSGQDLHLQAQTLAGDGRVTAGRDAIVQLQGDHLFTANNMIRANRDFNFTTTGTLTNTADMEAVRHLTVNAANINNLYGALMNAGNGTTFLKATDAVYNIGRIYGDDIAIEANSITNDGVLDAEGNTLKAAVIAARNDVDLGANTIINREHALIQSLRNMSIGGSLDVNRRATGKAAYLQNASATIDAGADLNLQVAKLDNLNLHFETRQERDAPRYVKYYIPDGSDTKYYDGIGAVIRRDGDVDKLYLISDGTVYDDYTIFYYLETTERTVVVRSEQGKIMAGGQIILSGIVNNDKSQILAGGAITGDLSGLTNTEAKGQTIVTKGGDGTVWDPIYQRWLPRSYSWYHTTDWDIGGQFDQYHEKVEISGTETLNPDLNILAFKENQNLDPRNNDAIGVGVDHSNVPTGDGSTIGGNQGNPNLADDIERGEQPLPNFKLPDSQLFPITKDPAAHYLIETDPKFTNYKLFLSSDYMLSRLGVDPQRAQKRMGDGFYEQKLINDQIAQLTGKRFLGDYTTNEQQYQALMESGIKMAEQFQLTPGIALTASQMAALTSDMVWMVSQEVTLPDGSKTNVLVPVVYLARVDSTQVQPTGSIISGRSVDLAVSGTVQNGGTLQATNNTLIQATDIINTGTLRSDTAKGNTVLVASNDIINTGGSIAGKSVGLLAGRDVVMSTTVSENKSSTGNAQHGYSSENNVINNVASVTADQLSIQSGRDISLTATKVDTTGNTTMVAGRDINLDTVSTKEAFSVNHDAQNNLSISKSNDIGTQISTGGNLVMSAGQDINAKAAYANANGAVVVAAGRDVNLTSGQQQNSYAQETYSSSSGLISSGSKHTKETQQATTAIGSSLTGGSIAIVSGRDTNVEGSQVIAKNDLAINAGRDLNIVSAQNTNQYSYAIEEKKTGFSADLMNGISYGSSAQDQSQKGTGTQQVGSDISGANVRTVSGRDTTITASAITADKDVGIYAGRDINVMAATEQQMQTTDAHSSSTNFGIMNGMNAGRFNQFSHITSKENTNGTATSQSTSLISANGGTLNLQAGLDDQYKGTGKGNVTTQGAELLAQNQLNIAGNAVDMQAVQNASSDQSHSETSSITLGSSLTGTIGGTITRIGDMAAEAQNTSNDRLKGALALKAGYDSYKLITGGQPTQSTDQSLSENPQNAGGGFGVSASLTYSQSEQDSNNRATQSRGTTAQAREINITAREGDITMEGAKVQAQDIALDAAKNINLIAGKNTADLHSTNSGFSVGTGATLGSNGQQTGLSFQVGASMSEGHANGSETTWDNTQITATNHLSVKSGGDTNLIGAQLAAEKVKADIGGNLNIVTLQDKNNYDSKQENGGFSLSVCIPPICGGMMVTGSLNYGLQTVDHNYQSATGQSGIVAGNGGFDLRVKGNTNLEGAAITSTATPDKNILQTASLTSRDLINTEHTESESISVSISTANVATNVMQNTLSNLNGGAGMPEDSNQRSNTVSVISPSNVIITGTGDAVKDAQSKATADTLTQRDASTANEALTNTLSLQQAQNLQAAQQEAQENLRAANLAGAVMTNVVGDVAQKAGWADGSPQKIIMHGIVGLIEAKIGGTSTAGGLAAGMSAEAMSPIISDYLLSHGYSNDPKNEDEFRKYNAMMNLGATLVGAAAGAVAGGSTLEAGAGGKIGQVADENNRKLHYDEKQRIKQKADGNAAEEERLTKAACYAVQCWAQYPEGSQLYNANYVSDSDAQSLKPELTWVQSMQSQGEFVYSGFDKATDRVAAITGISNDAIGGVPTGDLNKPFTDGAHCVTAECAAGLTPDRPLSQADIDAKRNGAADFAGEVSKQAGRFSAAATAYGKLLSMSANPATQFSAGIQYSLALTGTILSFAASATEQGLRPNMGQTTVDSSLALGGDVLGNRFPLASPLINEFGETIKTTPASTAAQDWLNQQWNSIINPPKDKK